MRVIVPASRQSSDVIHMTGFILNKEQNKVRTNKAGINITEQHPRAYITVHRVIQSETQPLITSTFDTSM